MPIPSVINDHLDQMIEEFPSQFQDKPNITALLEVWNEQIQYLEDSLWETFAGTQFFDAKGVNLDRYGLLLGLVRPAGMSDDEFASLVAGEVVARASDATGDSIRKITEAVTGLRNTNIIEINNTLRWRADGYPALTGSVFIYGYYSRKDRKLSGFEGNLLKRACPITTDVAVFGQHIQFDENNNNLWIPCEVILTPDPIGVETPLGNPLDELVTDAVGTDNLAVSATNFEAYGANWELSILPEEAGGGGTFVVNSGEEFENFLIDTDEESEILTVQTSGIDDSHGVLLEISTSY